MTNEYAIGVIKNNYPSSGYAILKEALDMAIVALQPTDTEQEPKSDDRLKEAKEVLREAKCSFISPPSEVSKWYARKNAFLKQEDK